jgi:RNA polymerase-binding transcription factor DksA
VTREADVLDQASELTQQLTDAFVRNVRGAARPEQVQNADGTWPHPICVECEDDIPPARLALGKIRCIHCQEDRERGLT